MGLELLLPAAAAVVAAFVQSATGFGFALILSPVLLAVLTPREAVFTLLVLGVAVSLLVLLAERRAVQARGDEVLKVLLAAVPGGVAGLLVLASIEKPALQVAVGVIVLVAAGLQLRSGGRRRSHAPAAGAPSRPGWGVYPAGLAAGVLTTSTSLSGPPLVLWLMRQNVSPERARDTLAASFLGLNLLGVAALVAATGPVPAPASGIVLLLLPLTVLGQLTGRRAFDRLEPDRFRTAALVLVAGAGAASVLAGLGAP